jgi:hypothetical protein
MTHTTRKQSSMAALHRGLEERLSRSEHPWCQALLLQTWHTTVYNMMVS